MLKVIPADYHDKAKGTLKLLWEEEWRAMGITQSLGWEHYEVHEPEPHILLFKYVCLLRTDHSCGSVRIRMLIRTQASTQLPATRPMNPRADDDQILALYHICICHNNNTTTA